MFIFISVLQDVIKRDCLHLHSTMIIFIFALALERFTEGSYLHSTMFIFIYEFWICNDYEDRIYIPLCLYLYSNSFWQYSSSVRIYIPLCLYLYFCVLNNPQDLYKFTFHYVYIYIPDVASYILPIAHLHSTMFIFISIRVSPQQYPSDLHSTMFIFILLWMVGLIFPRLIYIPLCLYLYLTSLIIWFRQMYLHSTMFIFI